ncbi:tRNA dihydrouridine(20/20a) synthase DusA [Oceanithermus sp.]
MKPDHTLSIAPMMERTDRHFRFLMRLITRHTLLYSEMVVDRTLIHGKPARHLDYHPSEHPLSLQIGSAVPELAARAVGIALPWGYDEINLNVGCPSERVKRGGFGVSLMKEPRRVARIVEAVRQATGVTMTIKHRVGVDDHDSYEFLARFVEVVAAAGARVFIVHARKAWTEGLSPKANREVPPLEYEKVYRLKRDFPELTIVINGGVTSLEQARGMLEKVDGVMVGRAAWDRPWLFARADEEVFGRAGRPSRDKVLAAYEEYLRGQMEEGVPLRALLRPLFNLFKGEAGGRLWRRRLDSLARAGKLVSKLRSLAPEGGLE